MRGESRQAQALLRVFEALGVPLIGAVDELAAWQTPSFAAGEMSIDDRARIEEDAARNFSALLSATIAAGAQLSTRFSTTTQEEAEDVRLKASTLAGSVIAQHYVLSGQMPDEGFTRRLAGAFDAFLGLADSFALLPEESGHAPDMLAARVEALAPFAQAVMRFSFGQDDGVVIRRLGERLCDKATALADAFSAGAVVPPAVFAQRELAFLKGCARLLAQACDIEMNRLQNAMAQGQVAQPPAPDVLADAIFSRFEAGLDVLRAVIGFVAGPAVSAGGASVQRSAPRDVPSSPPPAAPAVDAGASSNPMSFFVKKDAGSSSSGNSGEAA